MKYLIVWVWAHKLKAQSQPLIVYYEGGGVAPFILTESPALLDFLAREGEEYGSEERINYFPSGQVLCHEPQRRSSMADHNDLLHVHREIQQLKETVVALREKLEMQAYEKDHLVQEAVATQQNEIQQLRHMVMALRGELESELYEKDRVVQEVVSTSLDEIQQLKHTISALRQELESQAFQYQEQLQEFTRSSRDEIGQLQATIISLRQELEKCQSGLIGHLHA